MAGTPTTTSIGDRLWGFIGSLGGRQTPILATTLVNSDGDPVAISGGLGGDASTANQATQITAEPLTNTRLGDITTPDAGSVNAQLATIATNTTGVATAANQTTGNTSLASILAKIIAAPATEAKQDTQTTAIGKIGTRAYGAALTAVAVASTSAQSAAITGTEVLVHASTRCFIKNGASPTATADDIPLEIGEKFHLRITTGDKIAVIRDTADGVLNVIPVA